MSDKFVEETDNNQEAPNESVEFSSLDDTSSISAASDEGSQETTETPTETPPESTDDLPEKYRGKSAKDLAKMHQEAERALGRQGSEVGELRRLVDDFVRSQTSAGKNNNNNNSNDADEEVDFFADPQKAIDRAIARHPKVKEAELLAASMRKSEALATLKASHPDFQTVISSSDFGDWVSKSKVRQELFLRADQGYDYAAADELLSTFKERQQVINSAKQVEQMERKSAVKAASTGSAKGAGADSVSKKVYRRADIMELMIKNPDRYAALQPEIMSAYSEGRVR